MKSWKFLFILCILVMVVAGCRPQSAAEPVNSRAEVESQPFPGGPVLLREGIDLQKVVNVDGGSIKLALHPITGDLYILTPTSGLSRVKIGQTNQLEKVANTADIVDHATLSGMAFGPDGALYIVANRIVKNIYNQAVIRKGIANTQGVFEWKTLAETEPYPLSNTPFDHIFNGVIVSLDGKWVLVNSGSRTDHGEVENNSGNFANTREVALTAKIFKIPSDSDNLLLVNDEKILKTNGLVFVSGTRNAYDMAFAPNGDLFGSDNGPDADYPDELNWLREGQHYGFPWQFGNQDNPQQFPDYTSVGDEHLSLDFTAVQIGAYRTDPTFPKSPGGFTIPVANMGPDAAQYRADDGSQHDAAKEGKSLNSFTPHRSPLGLVFVPNGSKLPPDFNNENNKLSAFILSWGAAGGTLTDRGQDLLHLELSKQDNNYQMVTTQIVTGFKNPIDAVMIDDRLYVLEYGSPGALWQLTFK